jgi:hypothetical protein
MNDAVPPKLPAAPARSHHREPDAELWLARVGLVTAVAVLVAARTLSLDKGHVTLPRVQWPLPVTCSLRRLTGLPCPGCGLTRSLVALAHGDANAAWQFNPAGALVLVLLVLQIPLALLQEARRWAGRPPLPLSPLARLGAVLLMSVLVGQWLVRLVAGAW